MSGARTPKEKREAAIALWRSMDPRPSIEDFAARLATMGIDIKAATLRQWRARGLLPGDIDSARFKSPTDQQRSIAAKMHREITTAETAVAAATVKYSRELVQDTAAKAIVMAGATIDVISRSIHDIALRKPTDIVMMAAAAGDMMQRVAEITKNLQLLEVHEKAAENHAGTGAKDGSTSVADFMAEVRRRAAAAAEAKKSA